MLHCAGKRVISVLLFFAAAAGAGLLTAAAPREEYQIYRQEVAYADAMELSAQCKGPCVITVREMEQGYSIQEHYSVDLSAYAKSWIFSHVCVDVPYSHTAQVWGSGESFPVPPGKRGWIILTPRMVQVEGAVIQYGWSLPLSNQRAETGRTYFTASYPVTREGYADVRFSLGTI